jgi:hypothetical protein
MKANTIKNIILGLSFVFLGLFSFNANAAVHFTESFTSPAIPVSGFTNGDFVLSSGTWNVQEVQGLESLNAYNSSGGAVKFNRYLGAFISAPSLNSIGTVSFYYRNFSSLIGGGEFIVQKSVSGGAFSDIATVNFSSVSSYTYYSIAISEPSSDIVIRILCPDTNTGFLCVDEMQITDIGQTLSTNPSSLSDLDYFVNAGPSVSQGFNLSGNNLTGAPGFISVTAPTNFEVSSDNINFFSNIDIAYSSSLLSPTPVYVRLKISLSVNSYSGSISISGGGASSFTIPCTGSVSIAPPSTLTVNPGTLSGFNYEFGSGPSGIQSYNIYGIDLIDYPGNIIVTAPAPYEISIDYEYFYESLSISYTDVIMPSEVVYVRLKAGLASGTYNSQIIINSGGGASSKNVICNGSVSAPPSPILNVTPAILADFNYIEGSGPSEVQSYLLSGSSLTGYPGNITVTASSNYEISLNSTSGFTLSSLNIAYSSSNLSNTPIFVRLKTPLPVGTYNTEIIANAGGGATTVNVTCSGSVSDVPPPSLIASPSSLSGFNYIFGSGPSTAQFYNLSGTYLAGYPGNISVNAPSNYEVSLSSSSGFNSSINVAYSSATLGSIPIYVRLKADCIVETYNSEIIVNAGGGASDANVTCNGSVTTIPPSVLSVSPSSLSGFNYTVGSGPSAEQSYNLSGTNLTGYPDNITIAAPTNYEISLSSGTGYTSNLNVLYSSATLSSTPIYVRLKIDRNIGTYNSEIITNSGGGASTFDVTCNGSVTAVPPSILSVSPSSLSGFNYTVGSGPSAEQSYNLSGTNLTEYPDNITITAPTNYEISLSSGTGYTSSLNVLYSSATLGSTPIYVRLKIDRNIGTYNSEYITNSGDGATDADISCNGTVLDISTDPCLAEDFSSFTDGTHASPSSTDVFASLDSYTQTPDWEGYKVFSAGGEIKLGSSSIDGYIITPNINLSGGGTLEFDYAKWSSDAPVVQIFHASDGITFIQVGGDLTTTTDFQTHSVEITSGTALSKIKIGGTQRIYIDNIEIYCGGSAPTPVLSANPVTLSGFNYIDGSGPSDQQSFEISGTDLDETNVTLTPPLNYEISLSSGIDFQSTSILLTAFDGNSTTIFVRLKDGSSFGDYNSENIAITGGGADAIAVECNGTVDELLIPELNCNPTTLSGYYYIQDNGPSDEQSFALSGTNLNGTDINIIPATNYEISLNSGTGYQNSTILLPAFDGTLTTVYVRLKEGRIAGDYNSETILITGGGTTGVAVNCNGTVGETLNSTLILNPESLSGFNYIDGYGPSEEQSFEISGTNLDGNDVNITPPANYEISLSIGTGFQSTPISLTAFNGSTTSIYVRLKSGLGFGIYNLELVTVAGGGAENVNLICNGNVTELTSVTNPTEQISMAIYPNPVIDILTLSNIPEEAKEIRIYDITGKSLITIDAFNLNTFDINMTLYPKGIYFLNIYTKNNSKIAHKIIKF